MVNGTDGLCGTNVGQHHQFHHYNPGKSEFGEKRYFKISEEFTKNLMKDYLNQNF
jgi:GST-like protein